MFDRKVVLVLVGGFGILVAALIGQTSSAMKLREQKMVTLRGGGCDPRCAELDSCSMCEGRREWGYEFMCTTEQNFVHCAISYVETDTCECESFGVDCGSWIKCQWLSGCLICDPPSGGCAGCDDLVSGSDWC